VVEGGGCERRRTGAAPGGGVVDFGQGVHRLEGGGEVPGDDGHGVAGLLEEDGAAEADDAGSGWCWCVVDSETEEGGNVLPDDNHMLRHCCVCTCLLSKLCSIRVEHA
jgi:hypothetical protein